MYGILLKNGGERVKCGGCGGEGTLNIQGSVKTCRVCDGLGKVPTIKEVHRVMRRFQLPSEFKARHSQSLLLMFRVDKYYITVDTVIHVAQALTVSGIPCQIIFPIL